jgi:hypothetical protein
MKASDFVTVMTSGKLLLDGAALSFIEVAAWS